MEHYAFHTDPETSTTDGLFQTLRIAMRTGLPGPDSEPAGQ